MIEKAIRSMPPKEVDYHMVRSMNSGLWKEAGFGPKFAEAMYHMNQERHRREKMDDPEQS